jgi:hypothetical protein
VNLVMGLLQTILEAAWNSYATTVQEQSNREIM